MRVEMGTHKFEKSNLVTQKKGDFYKCKCGVEGWRAGLEPYIIVKKNKACTELAQIALPERVRLVNFTGCIGKMANGDEYDVVPCPVEFRDKYLNSVWVDVPSQGEPVRLLSTEWREVEPTPVMISLF